MGVLSRLLGLFKSQPAQGPAARPTSTDGSFVDAYRRLRPPSAGDLLGELKNIAFACASLNAATCAAYSPRLYVRTGKADPAPKCATKALPPCHPLAASHKGVSRVEEVINHPLLSLFRQVNPVHNAYDLWELTTLYQEVHGVAYWLLDLGPLNSPVGIWPLPSHQVRPIRDRASSRLVDRYEYRVGSEVRHYSPEEVICFRSPKGAAPRFTTKKGTKKGDRNRRIRRRSLATLRATRKRGHCARLSLGKGDEM